MLSMLLKYTDAALPAHTMMRRPDARYAAPFSRTRRWLNNAGRAALLCAAALLTTAASSPAHAVDIDALIGFGQSTTAGAKYRPDTWTPLTVYLTGAGVSGAGQLQVSLKMGDNTTVYTRQVSLREGALNDVQSFALPLSSDNNYMMRGMNSGATEVAIQLLVDGRKVAEKKLALPSPLQAETYNVLALTRDNAGLNFLTKKKLGLVHRSYNARQLSGNMGYNAQPNNGQEATFKNGINPDATLQLLYTDPRALPAIAQAYTAVDAIALADQPLDNLTEDQITALKTYVRNGGLLVVAGGGDLARLKSQFFSELLPITPTGVGSARDLPELAQRYEQPLGSTEAIALTQGALKPGSLALFGGSGKDLPLVSSRPYGAGTVVFTTFDYMDPAVRGWQGAPALWRDLLRSGNGAVSPRDLLANASTNQNRNFSMIDALSGKQATSTPGFFIIFVFLSSYLLLLVPVTYFILKKLDKREYAWVTHPILIVGFTFASYVIALGIKGGALTLNRAVVLETQANSDQAAGYGQMTLYSPRRTNYDLTFGTEGDAKNSYHTIVPDEAYNSDGIDKSLMVENDASTTTIRNKLVPLWDKRSFETPVATDLGGGIEATTTMLDNGSTVKVHVTNKTKYALVHCAILGDEGTAALPDLAPGASAEQKFKWNAHTMVNNINFAAGETVNRPNPNEDAAVRGITNSMTQAMTSGSTPEMYGGYDGGAHGYGHGVNAFVGWFYDPLLKVRVNGKDGDGVEANLLLVHLPTPTNASVKLRSHTNPFVAKAVTQLEDQSPGSRKGASH